MAFTDKINLWYTIKDYSSNRRNSFASQTQRFLPTTFVLDDDNEVVEFLRSYKSTLTHIELAKAGEHHART